MPVELPLDHLVELWPEKLRGTRVGALLHPASISAKLEHASRILERHNGKLFRLSAFLGPQHGFLGQTQDNMVEWQSYEHPRLGIPVYSLYGEHREPSAEMLRRKDWRKPWIAVAISETVTIPTTMPRVVSTERSLLARIALQEMLRPSLSDTHAMPHSCQEQLPRRGLLL